MSAPLASKFFESARNRRTIAIKEFDAETGHFYGLLSPYNKVDHAKEMVLPGAYTKTIEKTGGSVVMLWQHKRDQPIGKLYLEDKADGLYVRGEIATDIPDGQKAYRLIKKGIVKGLSIGFFSDPATEEVSDGIRKLKEIELFEGSIVTFPCAPEALIMGVKAFGLEIEAALRTKAMEGDFDEEYAERRTAQAGYTILSTLMDLLQNAWWYAGMDPESFYVQQSGVSAEAIREYCSTVFDQAKAEFMTALADYTGLLEDPEEQGEMKALVMEARAAWLRQEVKAAKTKKVDGENLPASAFLIVGDHSDTSTWKLPVKFSDEAKTKSHIRNAMARINQVQGVAEEDLAAAKAKLKTLAKRYGIGGKEDEEVLEDKTSLIEASTVDGWLGEIRSIKEMI